MSDHRAQWQPWLEELDRRREAGAAMGGPERVQKYMHSRGKLDARQRIERLFDPGTFREIGRLVGTMEDIPGDGFVCGYGRIDGRMTLAGAEDFTVLGGSIGAGNTAKRYRIAELAAQEGVPLVTMLEGAGHRLTDTGGSRAPGDLQAYADLSGQVPMVCIVMGASAGHGALAAPLSDFVIMTSYASMFTGGPPLVKAATGEDVTKEELGGADVCTRIAGSAHNVAPDDETAIDMARHYLGYFPLRSGDPSPYWDGSDNGPRPVPELLDVIPPNDRLPYDMHHVIELICDAGTFFEIQPAYGPAIIVGLGCFGGRPCGVVANNPAHLAGSVDAAAAIKATDFLEMIGHYDHPVLFLADNPGVMAGTKAEREGILKWGGKMYRAERRLTNAKIEITMRKAFGFGSVVMAQNPFDRQTQSYALPSVNMAAMPAEAGGRSAKLDAETQAEVEQQQRSGPYRLANRLGSDDVIDPREMRNTILDALSLAENR
ncbi:acyl-CoA carboxylase subunit beta [Candidatus Poriferisocius sp.]|uniref:acyl-CoA carboxylase subunit beta n=1 Tax=Candidatus Poriferisocius sp. TaxID=3101276 RepID=UPI003B5AA6F9